MKKSYTMIALLIGGTQCLLAETNALIEVKLFKDWVIKGEMNTGNVAIKNTGTAPILLANDPVDFTIGQLMTRTLPRKPDTPDEKAWQEQQYQVIVTGGFGGIGGGDIFFELLSGETHVYEGRKFHIGDYRHHFSDEMRFKVSVYLGNGFYLDSEPLAVNGVTPDSEEYLATINDGVNLQSNWDLVAVTYKNERWLYKKSGGFYPAVCPLSLMKKIRIEPHDGKALYKIWDGDKSMIFDMKKSLILEGADEHNVLGKWTRERKQRAEADNAEVRRRKAEQLGTKN